MKYLTKINSIYIILSCSLFVAFITFIILFIYIKNHSKATYQAELILFQKSAAELNNIKLITISRWLNAEINKDRKKDFNSILNSINYNKKYSWSFVTNNFDEIEKINERVKSLLDNVIKMAVDFDQKNLDNMKRLHNNTNFFMNKNIQNEQGPYKIVIQSDSLKKYFLELEQDSNTLKTFPFDIDVSVKKFNERIISIIGKSLSISFVFFICSFVILSIFFRFKQIRN